MGLKLSTHCITTSKQHYILYPSFCGASGGYSNNTRNSVKYSTSNIAKVIVFIIQVAMNNTRARNNPKEKRNNHARLNKRSFCPFQKSLRSSVHQSLTANPLLLRHAFDFNDSITIFTWGLCIHTTHDNDFTVKEHKRMHASVGELTQVAAAHNQSQAVHRRRSSDTHMHMLTHTLKQPA